MSWAGLATGVRVPYGEQGAADGVPVVFLHPYADSHRFFELALPYLPARIHAYLPTQRGHGDTDKPPSGYSLDELSGDLAAFLDAVGVGRAVVVGHSSGRYVAQRFALDHRQLMRALRRHGSAVPGDGGWTHMEGRNSVECDPTDVLDNERMMWRLCDKYPDVYSESGFPRPKDA